MWNIATRYFDARSPKPSIGHCVASAAAVLVEQLAFDADGRPFPEHANIIGWHDEPSTPDDELKHHWKHQAQRMAPRFFFVSRL